MTFGIDLDELACQLAPAMAKQLLTTPAVFGDPCRLHVGRDVHLVNTMCNVSSGEIWIEDEAFFGHNVSLITGTHDVQRLGTERQRAYPTGGRDIRIGRGAWLASNAVVIGPVTIGSNAVVAAGSVVLNDVPADWIYGGVPARPIKPIFGERRRNWLARLLRHAGRFR